MKRAAKDNRKSKAHKLRKQGLTYREIAERLSCSMVTAKRWCSELKGIRFKPVRPRKLPHRQAYKEDQVAKIKEVLREAGSLRKAALLLAERYPEIRTRTGNPLAHNQIKRVVTQYL